MADLYKEALSADTSIWVAPYGSDSRANGSFESPYASINAAVAAVTTTKKTILIMSGDYTLTAACDITKQCSIIGIGVVNITAAAEADYAFKTVLGALSSTNEIRFSNLNIEHSDDATQVGIQLDNTSATKKIICYIDNVSFGSDGGNSIDVDQGDANNAIRVYMSGTGQEVEGPVNISVKNNGQRLRAFGYSFIGGIVTSADAVACEIRLNSCGVLHEGVTGGNAAQTVTAIGCYSDNDSGTYAVLDTADLAGSHTENIIV
jgi:hypothetical protein